MKTILVAALAVLAAHSANAATVTVAKPLTITITPVLVGPSFNPANPSIDCGQPAGTLVSVASVSGGDGQPVTWSLTGGDTADFAIDSSGNIKVGPNGINANSCSTSQTVTVAASQP